MRTFSRATFEEARDAWSTGRFGPEWHRIRRLAADRGFIFPPAGDVHDDREAPHPSQRAIVYHALDSRPQELERIVRTSSSWSEVTDRIIVMERRLSDMANEAAYDDEWEREHRPGYHNALQSLSEIIKRIADSQ
jgi:hypothetical protein